MSAANEIPAELYTAVMTLVDQGHSVEDAISKARNASRNRSTGGTRKEKSKQVSDIKYQSPTTHRPNTDVLRIRIDRWTPEPGYGSNTSGKLKKQFRPKKNAHAKGREAAEAQVPAGWQCPDHPVLVAIIHWERKNRKKDSDNALACMKHALDGVCKGIGIDDRRFLTSMAFQKFDPAGVGYVDIIIRPATREERRLAP